MKSFSLKYVQSFDDGVEDSFIWRCEAEDYEHALEQLTNAEEGIVSVILDDVFPSESDLIFGTT